MKNILILAFTVVVTSSFGQTLTNRPDEQGAKLNKVFKNDTAIIVGVLVGPGLLHTKTAYFLDDKLIEYSLLVSINPDHMKSLSVIETPIVIDSIKYERQIRSISKGNYFPRAISLIDLKNKYFPELNNELLVFISDGNIIHGDYNTYEIDEDNLFAITLDMQNKDDELKLKFLKLVTRSKPSIEYFKSSSIWMTGAGVTLTK